MRAPIMLTVVFVGAAWMLQAPYDASDAARSMNLLLWLFAATACGIAWLTWHMTRGRGGGHTSGQPGEDA